MAIEIADESGSDEPADTSGIVAVARYAMTEMGVNPLAELSVLLVDPDYMTELNHRWMGADKPTDVLAFPMDEADAEAESDEPWLLGDIVLCPEVAAAQAQEAKHSTHDELELLTVHGVLHLLGYDHAEPDDEREMFGLQARILRDWRASLAAAAHRSHDADRAAADAADPTAQADPTGQAAGGTPEAAGDV